jgi:RND superfamily putative drug exporter
VSVHRGHAAVDRIARAIRTLSVPIVVAWLLIAATTNVFVPQLEDVGKAHNVSLISPDSPSLKAMKRMGSVFGEFDSDSVAMVVLESDTALGADAHSYYDTLVRELSADTAHVQHVQDFWGDPLTAGGAQSNDGRAAYVQVFLAGDQGSSLSLQSVAAVSELIDNTPRPAGLHTYLTGAAPLFADQLNVGSEGIAKDHPRGDHGHAAVHLPVDLGGGGDPADGHGRVVRGARDRQSAR